MKKLVVLFFIAAICFAFLTIPALYNGEEPEHITASKQRAGDAGTGYIYLTTGDYLKSGIPYSLFLMAAPKDTNNYLRRTGNNRNLSHDFTAINAPNGELVAAPNCLQCHAQVFEGKLVIGLGNSMSDFTIKRGSTALFAEKFLKNLTGENTRKYEAAKNFITAID